MRLLTQIFLASLIVVKIVLGSIFIYLVELDPLFLEANAMASEEVQKDPEGIAEPASHLPAKQDSGETGGEAKNIVEEEEIDLNFLLKKKAELNKEEEDLAKKRAELMALQEEINNKIAILTQLRKEIMAQMAIKEIVEEKKLKHLIKAYSAMKPQKAASLVERLDMDFAIALLSKMKGDVVGNILSFVDTEKAARISEQLAKKK
jgi:flagellar motility protein MotE (MotC chaperone)